MGKVGGGWKKSAGRWGNLREGWKVKGNLNFQIFFAFVHPGLDRQTLIQEYFLDENIFFFMKIFFDDG